MKAENNEPLAYCHHCLADRPMRWKERKLRGKSVDTWFVCAVCGHDGLEIKMLTYAEAVARNRINIVNRQ
tara:strand:- start:504 stop:713 length:210 start_codon:yes stop_codon:yes gene_type:complete